MEGHPLDQEVDAGSSIVLLADKCLSREYWGLESLNDESQIRNKVVHLERHPPPRYHCGRRKGKSLNSLHGGVKEFGWDQVSTLHL